MIKLYIITFLSLVAVGCKSQKVITNTDDKTLNYVTIYESACEGTCPVYTMTIFSDGSSKFNGVAHTKKIGVAEFGFSKESIDLLFSNLKALDFTKFQEKPTQVIDIPETKIVYNDRTIIIKDIRQIPKDFKEVILKVKELTRSSGFVN